MKTINSEPKKAVEVPKLVDSKVKEVTKSTEKKDENKAVFPISEKAKEKASEEMNNK